MHAILKALVGLAMPLAAAAGDLMTADRLVYRVEEQGLGPYVSRIMITAAHLRMDEGDDSGSYTLFDRHAGAIYNVDPDERMVLVIDPPATALPEPPVALDLSAGEQPNPGLPEVEGVAPRQFRLLANGEVCTEVTAAEGVMTTAVAALAQFYRRLADQHALAMIAYPDESRDPCDLAEHIYAPERRYGFGLPLALGSATKTEKLVDYDWNVAVDGGLFRVPEGYREITMPTAPAATE